MSLLKIAIDPGWKGAIAMQDGHKTWFYDCPGTQNEIIVLLREIVQNARNEDLRIEAIIEKVHSMPGMNCAATWKFAVNFSTWQSAMIAFKVPFIEVLPKRWMKIFGQLPRDKTERKNAIKDAIQKLYPDIRVTLKNADVLAMLSIWDKL